MTIGNHPSDPLASLSREPAGRAPTHRRASLRRDHLLDRLLGQALARPEVEEALARFLATFPSGLFVLQGATGLGKTTEMARLACRPAVVAHHFIVPQAGRDAPALVARSLFEQLTAAFAIDRPAPAGRAALAVAFGDVLGDISCGRTAEADLTGQPITPVLIVIDAIDDMRGPADRSLDFLPAVLPPHIYVVISTRPFAPINARVTPLLTYTLRPMTNEQIARALERAGVDSSPAAVSRAGRASQGNPLFLRWYLAAGMERSDDGEPATEDMRLDCYFAHALRALLSAPSGSLGYRLLSILTVARAPLSLAALSALIGARRRDLAMAVRLAGPLLTVNGERLALCHRSLAAYLLDASNPGGIDLVEACTAHAALASAGKIVAVDRAVHDELRAYDRRPG